MDVKFEINDYVKLHNDHRVYRVLYRKICGKYAISHQSEYEKLALVIDPERVAEVVRPCGSKI